ncbi:MAG: NTP transferase domain-containing protein [Chloroflexota bacterium]|nr:NTP transferase domain-containing protein [Chloroflexota bacterium]MDE2929550.1 NTP transferase domain-containing protein [Chloroflexota bacterium]
MTESDPDPHQATAAIIVATGPTERMQSRRATSLHALAGRPMAAYSIQAALDLGCSPVVAGDQTATSHLQDCFAPDCVFWSDGNSLATAFAAIPDSVGSVLLISGAMPLLSEETLARLVQRQQETASDLVVLTAPLAATPQSSGGLVRDAAGRIERILTDADGSQDPGAEFFSTGVICASRAWLYEHRDAVQIQDEGCLASLAALAHAEDARIETVQHTGADVELTLVADRADLALAETTLRARIRTRAMRGGVTLVDPASVWIDDTVTFGRDVTILPNCHFYGDTAIGDNCIIGPSARLQDTRLAANVTVMESVLEGAEVGENVRIGPFAHLRPSTVIAHDVEIGNYAELKNTRVSPGAKIHHVGYLGDTVVGNDVNVGAGTITCNYDGADKHVTEIGEGAFIGSGTLLVAPVCVGSKAMTGAGSVVTRDVPPQAKAYGVPARVRGVRALPADAEQDSTGEKKGA